MVDKIRKICVVTGSRAEYGLLRWVIDEIEKSKKLDLTLIVTGMHLSPEFGLTIDEIKKDGYKVSDKVEMLLSSDSPSAISKSIGLGLIGFSDKFDLYKPDLLILLGDRFEIFSAAISGLISCIPIAHIHGGESTQGVIDESIRHSITKMSNLHFVAASAYEKRVIQLGESPKYVFNVGGLGIDNINKLRLLTKYNLQEFMDFEFGLKNLIITFHPVTLEKNSSRKQVEELLDALDSFLDINYVFTMPNSDTDGRVIMKMIEDFCKNRKNAKCYKSLGQINYLSCLKYVDGVVGNSSSGLIEAPSFKKGTINIGNRQKGRLKAKSVIDCSAKKSDIVSAIKKLYSAEFQAKLSKTVNPYGNGGASKEIIKIITKIDLKNIVKKKFHDIK